MNKTQGFIILLALIIIAGIIAIFTFMERIEPGYGGIKVNLLGSDQGVEQELVGVGREWVGVNEKLYEYPLHTKTYKWTQGSDEESPNDEALRFQCEGLTITGDFAVAYSIRPDRLIDVFLKWRKSSEELTMYVRTVAIDELNRAASTKTVEAVYGTGKVALLNEVKAGLQARFEKDGIIIEDFFALSDFALPKQVKASIDSKIKASQEALQAISTAQKNIEIARGDSLSSVIRAAGEAAAMKMRRAEITQDLIQYTLAKRWNGVQPTVVSNNGQILDVSSAMKK